jgi:Ca2+-transporting ATPase
MMGDPTEGALLSAAGKAGIWKEELEKAAPFVDEIPFDSERKKMTVIRKEGGALAAFVKGAPDVLLGECSRILEKGAVRALEAKDREKILAVNHDLTSQAMRVLGVAWRELSESESRDAKTVEKDLIFVGLLAMIDPPREEAKEAVRRC